MAVVQPTGRRHSPVSLSLILKIIAMLLAIIATLCAKGDATLAGWPWPALLSGAVAFWIASELVP